MVSLADSAKLKQQGIEPPKKGWLDRAWTPFSYAGDFIKGTVKGLSQGLGVWARRGLKIGAVVAIGLFFLPYAWPAAANAIATALPMLHTGVLASTGAASFIPNGFAAIGAVLVYALGGAVVGAAGGAALGTVTGGAKEIQLRWRKEEYAEELAERGKMVRIQQQAGKRVPHWREYSQAHRTYRKEVDFRQFEVAREQQRDVEGLSWVDRVMNGRGGYGGRGF
jgi:hypothetical protein